MSLSLRALATRTSWPHSSKRRLTQGERVPVSIAMRIGGRSEAERRSKASGLVRNLPSSTTSPLCWSMRQRWEYLSPRSNPAVAFGCALLTSMVGRSSFHFGRQSPPYSCRPSKGTAYGGRPSHPIFLELRKGELLRIHLPKLFGK